MSFRSASSFSSAQRFDISAESAGQRLDRFLVDAMQDMSRNAIQQLIASGVVLVNGKHSKAGYMLRGGDMIQLAPIARSGTQQHAHPLAMPLDIVYEDADILVVNKPAGLVVHPAPGHHDDTLVNALLAYLPDLQASNTEAPGLPLRAGIIHRLDKDTSGLLIVAKHTRARLALLEQQKRHEIVKSYLALVAGVVSLDQGIIDAPIGRDPRHRQQMSITTIGSREARTHFRVLQRFAHHTLILLQLETGRTHQIRLHLKAIGHPVVGDPVYGSGTALKGATLTRQFLHAYHLQFLHPITGELLKLEAPLPAELQAILDEKDSL